MVTWRRARGYAGRDIFCFAGETRQRAGALQKAVNKVVKKGIMGNGSRKEKHHDLCGSEKIGR